jgi:hypothetical protein
MLIKCLIKEVYYDSDRIQSDIHKVFGDLW